MLCFHAEAADYAEIFGTVFVVALLGYVLRSLRSLRGIGKDSVLFSRRVRRLRRDFSAIFVVAVLGYALRSSS